MAVSFFFFLAVSLMCELAAAGEEAESRRLPEPTGEVVLEMRGNIDNTNKGGGALFDMVMLKSLPRARIDTSTSVTDGIHRFDGFLVRDLLTRVGARGNTITASALNGYVVDIDVADFERFDVIAAYMMDGRMLTASDKGPLWIVYPRDQHAELQDVRYDYRWVWQMNRIDVQ